MSREANVEAILFLMAEAARKNFGSLKKRRAAVTMAYCALAGKIRATAADRRMIERELREGQCHKK